MSSGEASLRRLHRERIPVDSVVYGWSARGTGHTWQQDPSLAESQEVDRRLQRFVRRVTRTSPRGTP